ncbi:MAG: hypothetical protein LKF71_07420 [Oscillospiraceae bacterium]|nr:hypothetical protein [Oscillospiraceae bacterium]
MEVQEGHAYRDLFTLMREEPAAKCYFANLPVSVREQMSDHAFRVNSLAEMQQYAENLTHQDAR